MVGCDTVIVFTNRMHELAEFYRAGLELAAPQHHGDDHLGFQLDNLYLGFDQIEDTRSGGAGVTLWFSVVDLQAAYDRFVTLGAGVRYPPTRKAMGDVLASLTDPDGNIFGLVAR